ncbi:MAG: alpha/beta hydrolase [Aquabacterium sp.]|nr:alpha/beta hydrolase [Aquabacterium sp.]
MAYAQQLAVEKAWQSSQIPTQSMVLQAWAPQDLKQVDALTVYIEGDGLAWLSLDHPSDDPSPTHPVGLQLALGDPSQTAVYLARPCQYLSEAQRATMCIPADWLDGRFSPRLLRAMSEALDALKQRHGAKQLVLIGYSGGAAMAALLASRRQDISTLITVAGNLDHRAWTSHHRLTPLIGSLNPADDIATLARVPQYHLVGDRDVNITPDMVRTYAAKFPQEHRPVVVLVTGFDHQCCWSVHWPQLWQSIMRGGASVDATQ